MQVTTVEAATEASVEHATEPNRKSSGSRQTGVVVPTAFAIRQHRDHKPKYLATVCESACASASHSESVETPRGTARSRDGATM